MVDENISLSKDTDKTLKTTKRKYNRSFKVTWGGRPYKSKKKEGFLTKRDDIKIVDGVCVLEGGAKKPIKKVQKKTKPVITTESIDVDNNIEEAALSLEESVSSYSAHFRISQDAETLGNKSTGISLIHPSMKTSYDYLTFFFQHTVNTFTPISGMGYLYRNRNPFQTTLHKIAMRDALTFKMVEEFAKITKATHVLRKHRIDNIGGYSSAESSTSLQSGWIIGSKENGNSIVSTTNTVKDLDIESYVGITSENNAIIETFDGKLFNELWLEQNGYDDFFEEKQIVKNFKDVYKSFETDALKRGAHILIRSKIAFDQPIDKREIVDTLTSLLWLLSFYSYLGKHNKNVMLVVGTCKELLYLLGKMNNAENQKHGQVGDYHDSGKILIASEHTFNTKKNFTYDGHNFFNSVKTAELESEDINEKKEIQLLSNWTHYFDVLTSMTIIPEKKNISELKKKNPLSFSNLSLKKDHYAYKIENNRLEKMNELKDIEYFSGADLQTLKFMNELTDLLAIKDEIDELQSDVDPLMILNFENQCMKLSVDMERYLNESEADRDLIIHEKKQGLLGLNTRAFSDDTLSSGALHEYEQLRTVNKIFALLSILQVHRRLLNRLTEDNYVKKILSEVIELLESKVPLGSALAQCLFGSMFIIGCELGNLFLNEESSNLLKGKQVVMSHLKALVDRGLVAAERAKDIIHHVWLTNSLNSTYKNWWVILKENDITIHLSL